MKYPVEVIELKDGEEKVVKQFKKFGRDVTKYVKCMGIHYYDCEYKVKEYTSQGVEVMGWSKRLQRFF